MSRRYRETTKTENRSAQLFRSSAATIKALVKWLVLGSAVGLVVGAVASVFGHALLYVNAIRVEHPGIVWALPLGGLLIVFLYRISRNSDDRGTNTVIASIHSSAVIPFRMAPLIFVSTIITHLFGGSAGREGAALQLGGSIAGKLGGALRLSERDRKLLIMSGMSAAFSALFGTPLAAAVFSIEVVSVGIMHYSALVPCVTAAMLAHFTAQAFHVPPEIFPVDCGAMNAPDFFRIAIFAAAAGFVSILFCLLLHWTEDIYKKLLKNPYLRVFAAGILVAGLSVLLGTEYLGSGMAIIEDIFHHGTAAVPLAFLLKMIFTALTLGGGFKGGEIVPSLTIGAALGSCAAALLGLPVELVAACGMVGVFCGVTNSPISSLLIAFELFGFAGMPYYLVTVAISYMISGQYGLYRAQRLMYSKTEPRFIDTTVH